jgi:hypothetical protein
MQAAILSTMPVQCLTHDRGLRLVAYDKELVALLKSKEGFSRNAANQVGGLGPGPTST